MPISRTPGRLLALLLAVLACAAAQADAADTEAEAMVIDLMHYTVSDLRTGEPSTLDVFRGKPTVLLIFEPGCRYCARQSRILNRMLATCDNLQAVGLGFNGSRRRLLDFQDDLSPDFPAFMAEAELVYDMGEIVITPVLMLADSAGHYELHLLGLRDRDALAPLVNALGAGCPT